MPSATLTDASRDKGHTPQAREKANRTRMARHPIMWLKRQVALSKMPPEVRSRVEKLFSDLYERMRITPLDDQQAQREAFKLAARIHWTRATHRLLNMDPVDPGFMTVSKITAQWTLIDGKLNSRKGKGEQERNVRRQVPTAGNGHSRDEAQDSDSSDAETA